MTADLDRLRAENATLKTFARWAVQESAFAGCDLQGEEVQDKAEELGLIRAEPYDGGVKHRHMEEWGLEIGDPVYVFSALLEEPK